MAKITPVVNAESGSSVRTKINTSMASVETDSTISGDGNTGTELSVVAANINHDELGGFVANEHIDWTNATQNVSTTGTVNGRDVVVDGTKLDSIESGATADQTASEIKILYESEADTNAFDDAAVGKLAGIQAGATNTPVLTGSDIKGLYEAELDTNAYTDAEVAKLAGIEANATADQTGAEIEAALDVQLGGATWKTGGATLTDAQVKTAYENNTNTNVFTDAEQTKLAGVATGATDDQTGPEIELVLDTHFGNADWRTPAVGGSESNSSVKTKYEANANTNAFTDVEKSKLGAIESNATADMTGSEIKTAYEGEADTNVFTDAEQSKLIAIESGATADQTGAEIKSLYEAETNTNAFTDAEKSKLASMEGSKFLGTYLTAGALTVAHPNPAAGSYAHVDAGPGQDATVHIWDDDDNVYREQASTSTAETSASIKIKYESNADTNAFSDSEKTKLSLIVDGATPNSTDSVLLNRTNHTGTQTLATISDAGSAAAVDAGSAIGEVPVLVDVGGNPSLPVVDGSQLTGVIGAPNPFQLRHHYTADDTFVVPAGVSVVYVSGMGGGGGGCSGTGAVGTNPTGGGNRFGGQRGENGQAAYLYPVLVTPGQNIPVTVGAGGIGGSTPPNNNSVNVGTDGGASLIGNLMLEGGAGGAGTAGSGAAIQPDRLQSEFFSGTLPSLGINLSSIIKPANVYYNVNDANAFYTSKAAYSFASCGESGRSYGYALAAGTTATSTSGIPGMGSPFEVGSGADGGQGASSNLVSPVVAGNGADATLLGCGGGGGGAAQTTVNQSVTAGSGGNGAGGFIDIYY